jgi:hypothetical protein
MKVMFVGEGPIEIGHPEMAPRPGIARGVLPLLARKVVPEFDPDSVGLFWREIPVLPKEGRKRGWTAKVASAMLLAWGNGLNGTVLVADKDRDEERLGSMEEGIALGNRAIPGTHVAVCGLAKESIEAWTLAAVSALASVLKVEVTMIQRLYKVTDVEELYQRSGKLEKRPKELLAQIAQLANRTDSIAFREEVANETEIGELINACPQGFKPFAERLRAAFGPRPIQT